VSKPDHDQDGDTDRGGQVVPLFRPKQHLPDVPRTAAVDVPRDAEIEPTGPPLEGEVLTPEEYAERKALRRSRPIAVVVAVIQVARSETATNAGRATLRAGVTIVHGLGSWGHQWWDKRTHGVYRRAIQAAEVAGDKEQLDIWTSRLEEARKACHQRRVDAPKVVVGRVLVAGGAVFGLLVLVLFIGLAVQATGAGEFMDVIRSVRDGIRVLIESIPVATVIGAVIAPPALLWAAWREGRRRGNLPTWVVSPAQREDESVMVTPMGIAEALANLGISPLNRAIKDGWTVTFITQPVRVNNRGYQAVFSIPLGVTPDMIADKGEVLARNLYRAPLEVWPAASDSNPGYVDLWVCDPGLSEKPAPEYPLLHSGTCDVFSSVPMGVSQRGDAIGPPLVERNMVFGGLMGQGKSNAARVVMLGAALDPLAELWVYVFANNGDFDAYAPRLSRYVKGVEDDVAADALRSLHELYTEVARREQRLAEVRAKKVTRGLAEKHPDLRPVVALFSECHELFSHEEYGKQAADVATQTLRRARKTGVILLFDTQSARAEAIPPKIVELVSLNACFAVKTWRSNDGFLGDGSFQAGIRATELRPGKDRGTSLLTGATPERFEVMKWHFVEVNDDTGFDAAADVIARAVVNMHPSVPSLEDRPALGEAEERSLLDDVSEVLGAETVMAPDVPARLRELAPHWLPYQRMNGKSLVTALEDLGVFVARTHNRRPIDPAEVRKAMAQLSTADLDDEGDYP
jgi:DNA segregation ATPase FtsK/SpoIIIE, S-DNA-T family